jgi:ADP-L-glycero-D-manno-heptose 6-epimerase
MKDRQFIVTGGAGFIGSNLVASLNARGATDIVVVDTLNHPEKERNLAGLAYREFVTKQTFRERFLGDRQSRVDTVFHLGACSSTTEQDAAYLDDNNVCYTRQLCEWCLAHKTRFVYASSAATYGQGELGYSDDHALIPALQPLNLYGLSKQTFDLWALETGALERIAGIKYFNVYGPRENHKGAMRSVVNKAYRQILDTGELQLFRSHRPDFRDGEQLRDFVYVRDAVAVTLFMHDHPDVAGIFNCGTGEARSWLDLGRAVFAAMDRDPRIAFVDMPASIREKYQYYTRADIAKLRRAGFDAPLLSIEAGADDYVRNHLALAPAHA